MISLIKHWIYYTFISLILGFCFGFCLIWLWSFFLMFLGYGDSGPSWINAMNDIIFFGGLIFVMIGGQFLFFFKKKVISFLGEHFPKKGERI